MIQVKQLDLQFLKLFLKIIKAIIKIIKSTKNSKSYGLAIEKILSPRLSKLAVCFNSISDGTVWNPLKYQISITVIKVINKSTIINEKNFPLFLNKKHILTNIAANAM